MSRQPSIRQVHTTDGSGLTHLPGVGYVPSGPRISRQNRHSTDDGRRSGESSTVYIKEEEEDAGEYIDNTNDRQRAATRTRNEERKVSEDLDYNLGFLNDFRAELASQQSERSSSYRSGSARRQHGFGNQSRQNSRSSTPPGTRTRGGSDLRYASGSPMFFPESGGHPHRGKERTSSRSTTPDETRPADIDNADTRCTCPISYNCNHRSNILLDCRPLVREWRSWRERQDQEAFDMQRMSEPLSIESASVETLERICNEVERLKNADRNREARRNAIAAMRQWILEVVDTNIDEGPPQECVIGRVIPCLSEFLGPDSATLRQRSPHVPSYIEEELAVLQRKWESGDFDGAVDRGLIVTDTVDTNGTHIRTRVAANQEWPHYVSALYFGEGTLVNGQVWHSRAELQRDGVHAPPIAGISGAIAQGARSIVLGEFDEKKNEGYADIDMGEVIEYMGTALPDEEGLGPTNVQDDHMNNPGSWNNDEAKKPTRATRAMMKSLETGNAVRVIRSHKMCSIVKNKPIKGYRYDGLYRVVRKTAMKEARQIWSFRLERIAGQGRLRGFEHNEPQPDSRGTRKGHFSRTR